MSARLRPVWRAFGGGLVAAILVSGCAPAPQVADAGLRAAVAAVDTETFTANHPGQWVSIDADPGFESVSITNYDPMQLPPPEHQESIAFGRVGSSAEAMQARATVYSVGIQIGPRSYLADFDAVSKGQLFEDGEWPLEEDKDAYLARQFALIDATLGR